MKKKINNSTHLEGYVYEHKLENKVTGENSKNPGTNFISGTLSIATDDEMLNVVQVHFTYVTATTSKGKANQTYGTLQNIIDGKIGNVMEHGAENAGLVRIDSALDLNEWYDTRDPSHPLVSLKRNEGGFVHVIQKKELADEGSRATFDVDMLITSVARIERDDDSEGPEKARVKGCVFNYRGAILPVDFTVPEYGIDYFESLDASPSNPVFTEVKGIQVSKTVSREVREESAFGKASVKIVRSSQREWEINWARPDTYEWDSEATILASELTEKMAEREVYLAELKKRQDEFQASRNNAIPASSSPVTAAAKKEYNF